MDYLQRLLGALQRAVDFASSFTTYLLGDDPHPGAEDSTTARDRNNDGDSHDCEVERTHNGTDISPRELLEIFEGPLTTEEIPPNLEIQVTLEASVHGAQPTESIPELAKWSTRNEGWEESKEKLSETCQIPGDAPHEMVTTTVTGGIKETVLVESAPPWRIHPWDAGETIWMGGPEKVMQEEVADTKWDLGRPLARGEQHGELSGEGGINVGQERELKENLWNEEVQQETSDLARFLGEQERELGKMTQTGRFQHQEVGKTMDLQLESEKDHKEESIKEQSNVAVGKEDTQQAMIDNVETLGDKAGALEEENKMGRTHQWEPIEKPEEVGEASKGEERELEDGLCNKGVQERSEDWVSFVEECHGEAERAVWIEWVQYGELEVADEMVGGQELEPEKVGKEVPEATEDQQGEPDMLAMKEGSEQTMLGRAEIQEEFEGEDKPWKRSNLWELSGESQEVQETSKWKRDLEGSSWKEGDQEDAVDWAQVAEEQHGGLQKAAWTEGFQDEGLEWATKEVESLKLEAEEMQGEVVEADGCQQGQPNIVAEKEGHWQAMLHGAEIEEGPEVELEGEKEVERKNQWDVQDAGGTTVFPEKEPEEALWDGGVWGGSKFVEEEQRRPEGTAWSGGCQNGVMEACDKMVEHNKSELEEEGEEDKESEKMYQEEPDMTLEKEGLQQAVLVEAETQEEQQEAMERKYEIARSHQWELKRKAKDPEGSKVGQEREQEILSSNEKVQQGEPCQGQFVGEQQRGLEGVTGSEGYQYGGLEEETKIIESPQLDDEKGEEEEEAEAEEKEGLAVEKVVQQLMLSEAEIEREHIEVVEEEDGRNHQWEVEEMGLLEDLQDRKPKGVADTREGHQGELEGSEELERHREEETEEPERNKVDVKGEEEEEQTGDAILESDQREELEILADVSGLDEEELGEITRDYPEKAERSLQPESTAHSPSLEEDPLAGCRVFPSKVTPLDTSAQKERVLLRRKSSIRRAPSLKKVRSPTETSSQEMQIMKDTPPPAHASIRPTLRHSGFGPMHPNMMAELQMRLRKPQ